MGKSGDKILIIGSCTSSKKYSPPNEATENELDSPLLRKQKEEELNRYIVDAFNMYQGKQHKLTCEAFKMLQDQGKDVNFWIISAGYGLIRYNTKIIPYDVTFAQKNKKYVKSRGELLKIPDDFDKLIMNYDKVILLLGKEYLLSLNFPRTISEDVEIIAMGGKQTEKLLPDQKNIHFIPAGKDAGKEYGAALIYLKGVILKKMVEEGQFDI